MTQAAVACRTAMEHVLFKNVRAITERSRASLTQKERWRILLSRIGESMAKRVQLPQGTLELLVLKSISLGPLHGYGIMLRVQQISGERLELLQGSFYTAVYRLERNGWIEGEWGESENNRRAKFYRLTTSGRRQLKEETTKWSDMADVVANILRTSPEEI